MTTIILLRRVIIVLGVFLVSTGCHQEKRKVFNPPPIPSTRQQEKADDSPAVRATPQQQHNREESTRSEGFMNETRSLEWLRANGYQVANTGEGYIIIRNAPGEKLQISVAAGAVYMGEFESCYVHIINGKLAIKPK